MSYSQQVRDEIFKNRYKDPAEWAAEAAAICLCAGCEEEQGSIHVICPREDVAKRLAEDSKSSGAFSEEISYERIGRRGGAVFTVHFPKEEFETFIEPYLSPDVLCEEISENDALRRAMLRGAFAARGSMADPNRQYRIEILCKTDAYVKMLVLLMHAENIQPMTRVLDNTWAVYFKKHDEICDFLVIMGAANLMMELSNIRARHDVNKMVTRSMNLDNWTMQQQAEASARRTRQIMELLSSEKAATVPKELMEVARVHIENPGLSLTELGKLMDPPISKSGMNHRLKKLLDLL
ncbi:MAG: DNA-binding protein WhiA [Clostridiales bacterium]|nr:DNA-binding protein WhiA [Clostridiales bacterium]